MGYRETVTSNLYGLSNSTVVSVELATLALQEGLVTQEEFEILTTPVGPGSTNYNKATILYTKIVPKWTQPEFDVFLSVLERSGNAGAVEILQSSSGKCFNDILTKICSSNGAGSFEGYLLEDELHANQIVTHLKNTGFNLKDAIFSGKSEVLERLVQLMNCGKVWWNGSKPQLPSDYIDRRVFIQNNMKTTTTLLDLVLPVDNNGPDWTKWDDHVLILLVDSPGMGKSCALTRLEQELRKKLGKSPRIIIRINLNSVRSGVGESAVETGVQEVIKELFHPLKNISTGKEESPVFVLLDGLDEVLPQNQESVLSVIRFLLSDKSITKEWVVEKVVLTTRPHMKEIIESQFNVRAYSLDPLTQEEQEEFIQKRTGRKDGRELLNKLSRHNRDLMSNPLMLSMYCSVLIPGSQSNSFDQYEIYMEFMVKKHELHIRDKIGRSHVSCRVLKPFLTSTVPFYNCVAIQDILGSDMLSKVIDLAEKAGKAELIRKVSSHEKESELISFGVVVKEGEKLKFAHRSFAEFFYVQLMTDIEYTPKELRNALFALGYHVGNNLAMFLSCVIGKDKEKVDFISKGWTEFVPIGERLRRYVEKDGILCDHIMSITVDYAENCPRTVELLISDICDRGVFVPWLSEKTDETWVRNLLLNDKNKMILAALVFSVFLRDSQGHAVRKVLTLRKLCRDLWTQKITSMPLKAQKVISLDILRDTRHHYNFLHPRIFTWLASVFRREKLHHLIVNEETRVTDLIAHSGPNSVTMCLGNEFLPNKLLNFRFKFGEKKDKSFFNRDYRLAQVIPHRVMERVWEEVEENIQDAVQVVHDDGGFGIIRHMEGNLRSFEGSSELKQRKRGMFIDILAKVDWSNVKSFNGSMFAYGRLSLTNWEQFPTNQRRNQHSLEILRLILGCLMLSALNEERVPAQVHGATSLLVPAPFGLLKEVVTNVVYPDIRNLLSFIANLSRELLLNCATMKTKDPFLLSDLPTVWEVFFHKEKGLAKVQRQKTMAVLNEDGVMELIFQDLLQSDASLSPEVELRRVILSAVSLLGEERVKRAMTGYRELRTVARRASDVWLKNVGVGKNFIVGVVQVYLELFHGEFDPWIEGLAAKNPLPLLVVMEEKVRSGGGQQWINALKQVQVLVRGHFRDALTLNFIRNYTWKYIQYNRDCDWFEFLMVMLDESPEIKNKIPADYVTRTKVSSTWQCSLLRVWIQLFGMEETRRQTEESVEYESFWEGASREMKDGELLHIAVELGSLIGVEWTAYPKTIVWRDGNYNNRTALELAEEKLGKCHKVTQYLQRLADNLNERGFFKQ